MSNRRRESITSIRPLADQLKAKGRVRRDDLQRMSRVAHGSARPARNDLSPSLELIYLPLDQLRPASRKLRKVDAAHVREVAAVIAELGFCDPVLIGKNNVVLDSEVRLEAAKLHGLERVPCLRVDHLTEEEQRVLRLAVNRLAEKGEWDLDELKIEFNELILADAPIEVSGFTLDEIDHITLGDDAQAVEEGPVEPDAGAKAVARPGDIFQLGPHRLICGSATDATILRALMEGDSPASFSPTSLTTSRSPVTSPAGLTENSPWPPAR